ncbi:putative regulator of amino acid metabolism, contains ACT domain [Methanomethylovorans hollandica DSM 15978]|uniref:Putative regulator of amino acid metabolism, contains ACT domain n=1 Tax=Methanomethylovorans hollandica (strain DSM 15978 / NBRC 107637 / DMS1) TaxID=867904 RepID=L0KZI9_METHD|nr:putative regulator of amino acid metabolism, contains ACT domain [Methanomethylovorans hollandica DSM 15978]
MQKFEKHPAQQKVIRLLFERGFQVNQDGKVTSGKIEIPHTQLAREVGVDRRVVDSTTEAILEDPLLKNIFEKVHSMPLLRDVAPSLGLGVIIIIPDDAAHSGIIADVAGVISDHGISIRQAVSDDPYFTSEPRLTIITDSKISGEVVEKLLNLKSVKGVNVS